MKDEIMKVVSEDANEVLVEVAEDFVPDNAELKKLGLIFGGIIIIGGVTYVIFKKIKLGSKFKNLVKKILPSRKHKDAEEETTEE